MKREKGLSTPQVEALLAARYAPPEYATLFNVKNRTGYGGGSDRFCDALAMNLYPSRGLEVLGFEVKVSRGDWIKERDEPAKAEAIARFCDRWYLVVGDTAVLKDGELPAGWGLLVPDRGGLKVAKEAPKLEAQPLDRRFIAAMLRRATETSPEAVAEAERRGHERGYKKASEAAVSERTMYEERIRRGEESHLSLRQAVLRFEQAAGIAISGWQANRRIGEAVRLVLAGRIDADLVGVRDQLARLLGATDEAITALRDRPAVALPPEQVNAAGSGQ